MRLGVERLDPARHARSDFACGEASLDRYLQQQATQHHRDGISTTHVLLDHLLLDTGTTTPIPILGYYTLAAAQLQLSDLAPEDQRRLPRYPVPAVRMARLAVTHAEQGKGHGEMLLAHAVARCLGMREELGVRVLLVDALHAQAASFYVGYGFRPTASDALTLYLPL